MDGLRGTITPDDVHSGDRVCTAELRHFQHVASLRFRAAGSATVIVRGRQEPESRVLLVEREVAIVDS